MLSGIPLRVHACETLTIGPETITMLTPRSPVWGSRGLQCMETAGRTKVRSRPSYDSSPTIGYFFAGGKRSHCESISINIHSNSWVERMIFGPADDPKKQQLSSEALFPRGGLTIPYVRAKVFLLSTGARKGVHKGRLFGASILVGSPDNMMTNATFPSTKEYRPNSCIHNA